MPDFLVFQLHGPMAAWGDIAVGETRASTVQPSKSAVLGLLSAALGIDRQQDPSHAAMVKSYGFGCKVVSSGSLLVDYHTVQVPPHRRKSVYPTRKAELSSASLGTLLSSREYRCDAAYTVALWSADGRPPFTLEQMAQALRQPVYTLYLGRKNCPPALPMQPRIMANCTLKQALDSCSQFEADLKPVASRHLSCRYHWEVLQGNDSGLSSEQRFERWDNPTSRKRWQFSPRSENLYVENKEE